MFSAPASQTTFDINKSSLKRYELLNEQQFFCAKQQVRDELFMTNVASEAGAETYLISCQQTTYLWQM